MTKFHNIKYQESSTGSIHPIYDIATSKVSRLKTTRNEGDQISRFFNQESEGTVSNILSDKWLSDCGEVGDKEI